MNWTCTIFGVQTNLTVRVFSRLHWTDVFVISANGEKPYMNLEEVRGQGTYEDRSQPGESRARHVVQPRGHSLREPYFPAQKSQVKCEMHPKKRLHFRTAKQIR